MFWERCKDAFRGADAPGEALVHAPEDCQSSIGLGSLLAEGRRNLRRGYRRMTIDLSPVRRMNGALLATLLLLVRETRSAGAEVRLTGAGDEFRNWARTFGLLEVLEGRGVLSPAGRVGAAG